MSSTRTSAGGEFKAHAGMSSPRIAGINIGLNIVIHVARAHGELMRRAMLWLANYATMRGCTADALAGELGMGKGAIRAALTDPEFEDDLRFIAAVSELRAKFEATIDDMVDTGVRRVVDRAMGYALKKRKMIELLGKTRMGKSDCARVWWLRNLDRVVWFECPTEADERTWLFTLARALGIGVTSAKKPGAYKQQIRACFGALGITCLIVDEGHRLWPADPRRIPKRIEFLRELYADGHGCSVVIIATPQFTNSLAGALETGDRWAPGQYEGRVVPFHLDDTMPPADLAAVARRYAPEASAAVIDALVEGALANDGYCGHMVNVIDLARDGYLDEGAPLTLAAVTDAQLQMAKGRRIAALVAAKPPRRKAA